MGFRTGAPARFAVAAALLTVVVLTGGPAWAQLCTD
jgi:hypothetical protein